MKETLERFNEWWFTGKVRKELAPPFKRYAFKRLAGTLRERQALLLVGPRRVGKSTLLYQTIEGLLEKVPPSNILYFSFDEEFRDPAEVLGFYEKRILAKPFEEAGRVYIFLDEVQYAPGWASTVKRFYDLYPNLKFILSGSSALPLSKEAMEKLAGRFFTVELGPLLFSEFLELRGLQTTEQRRVEAYFQDYLRKSGFPELAGWEDENRIAEYVRSSVVDRVVFRDLPLLSGGRDAVLAEQLLRLVLSSPGLTINVNNLSRDLGRSRVTISHYLRFLELSLLVRSLSNFRTSSLSGSRKLKRYYPATPSMIFACSRRDFETKIGAVLETYVVSVLRPKYYYRERKEEIDVILTNGEVLPVEVKESAGEREAKEFSKRVERLGARRGLLVSWGREEDFGRVKVVPVYALERELLRSETE
ncbi:MAG: ATP-binding protein [Candidatus Hadarchaeales archaeon]